MIRVHTTLEEAIAKLHQELQRDCFNYWGMMTYSPRNVRWYHRVFRGRMRSVTSQQQETYMGAVDGPRGEVNVYRIVPVQVTLEELRELIREEVGGEQPPHQ